MTSMTTFASKVLMPSSDHRSGSMAIPAGGFFFSKETSTSKPTTSDLRTRVLWRQVLESLTEPSFLIHASQWQGFFWKPPCFFFYKSRDLFSMKMRLLLGEKLK